MSVVVLPRWAGVLAAAAGLTVAGLAAAPATASAHTAASSHAAASGPSAAPRFVAAHHAARLPSGFAQVCPQPVGPRRDAVLDRGALRGLGAAREPARVGDAVAGPAAVPPTG